MKESWIIIIAVIIVGAFLGSALTVLNQPERSRPPVITLVGRTDTELLSDFIGGRLDAIAIGEPYATEALLSYNGHRYLNSTDVWPGHVGSMLAYDENWYTSDGNSSAVLQVVTLLQMKAVAWLAEAMNASHENHSQMISWAKDLTGRSNAVLESALISLDYDCTLSSFQIRDAIERLDDNGLLGDPWNESTYDDASQYASDVVTEAYTDWAGARLSSPLESHALDATLQVRLGYLSGNLANLPFWVAYKMGWYGSVNVNVTLVPYPIAGALMEGFNDNDVDIGVVEPGTALRLGLTLNDHDPDSPAYNDAKVKFFCNGHYGGSVIVVKGGLDVDDMRDLEGHRLGVPGEGTMQHLIALAAAQSDYADMEWPE